jgi:ABC-type multidrug transport system fused ATPase/permease subunit
LSDLLATSAATWRDRALDPPVVPLDLVPPPDGTPVAERLRALRRRHLIREQRAQQVYAASRSPERGWPVADNDAVFAFVRQLISRRRGPFTAMVVLNALAAAAALFVPRLLGDLIDGTVARDLALSGVTSLALLILVVVAAQALFTFLGQRTSTLFGQDLLSSAREYIIDTILRLPLGRVEGASTGDLVTRVTRDVGTMSRSVQYGVPMAIISLLTVSLSVVAMLLNSLLLAVPALLLIGSSMVQVRRYLRRAQKCYIAEGATYSRINTTLTETVEGARTVEALGLTRLRLRAGDDDIALSAQAERYGMTLRNLLFAVIDVAFNAPRVLTLLVGAYGYQRGWTSLGEITAAVLYVESLSGPLDRLVGEVDRLQVGAASTSRLLGIAQVPPDRAPGDERPHGPDLVGEDLRFAYREGHDVLHGIDLDLRTGERLAIVGPSGSGKSTLGRLLSGINGPRTGSVRVGGVELTSLPLELLRTEVALVTQEHHVFVGTLRDNILLSREDADDDAVWAALSAVGSADWVRRLPSRLDTMVGSGQQALTPAQAQQIALARLIVADPHTLVLDEATSLIDPRTARTVEGSMSALLSGRTVVAIAHRLHTAHDADRIAVVIDGRVAELGSHDELVELGGEYAALWRAWTS